MSFLNNVKQSIPRLTTLKINRINLFVISDACAQFDENILYVNLF